MLCNRQPRFLEDKPIRITHLLEIRLAPIHWNRIKYTAWARSRTYSTITRYCVLRLARKCSLRWTEPLRRATVGVQDGIAVAREMHRHMMCLYGDDEKIIRLAAIELGLTITALVRLALELYLRTLVMEKHSSRFVSNDQLTWEGIRFTKKIQIFALNGSSRPMYRHLSCINFDADSYW